MRTSIAVVGSLNMDFVVSVPRLPVPGETILGSQFQMLPGGKGANQAYAAGRLARGLRVRMAGRVGYDLFADHLRASLAGAGVDVSAVSGTRLQATGVATIWVDATGQNSIVVAPGANAAFTPADVESLAPAFAQTALVLCQLETPLESVAAALKLARKQGARTVLDPAPAQPLTRELLSLVDVLTPNEQEAAMLLQQEPARLAVEQAGSVARHLRELGPGAVILKLGDRGCYYLGSDFEGHVPAFPVEAKDTTAAGDTFNAAFAVALGEGQSTPDALRFANAAAALSVMRMGAQASVPTRAEVDAFLATRA
jgi:ribokinase